MPSLGDDERRPLADDARRLAEDHLEPMRVLVGGELASPLRRLHAVELDRPALRLRHDLVRDDDDVALLEGRSVREHVSEVVALADLLDPLHGDHPQLGHSRPVSRKPATAW